MTNADVVALSSAGLGDDLVIAKIHAAGATNFDTSLAGLKQLKAAGVSSPVIAAMINPGTGAGASAFSGDMSDPDTVHPAGIYLYAPGSDGKPALTKLSHITSKNTKTGGFFLSEETYGLVKAHTKALIDGASASVQTTDTDPVFYAYIPEDNNTFGGSTIAVSDFTLVKFSVKGSSRQVNTASISPWGSSVGTDQAAKQGFTSTEVKPGVYKMTLVKALPAGQYAFQTNNYGAFYDFGIEGGSTE